MEPFKGFAPLRQMHRRKPQDHINKVPVVFDMNCAVRDRNIFEFIERVWTVESPSPYIGIQQRFYAFHGFYRVIHTI